MIRQSRTTLGVAMALGALLATAACSKKETAADTQTSAGAVADSTANATAIAVADVDVGRHVSADKKISDKTDDFAPKDSIYASVHTTGNRAGTLTARWTFQDGQTVDEQTQTLAAANDAYTEFQIAKPTGWPKGKYTLHVLVNGNEAKTKDFTVK